MPPVIALISILLRLRLYSRSVCKDRSSSSPSTYREAREVNIPPQRTPHDIHCRASSICASNPLSTHVRARWQLYAILRSGNASPSLSILMTRNISTRQWLLHPPNQTSSTRMPSSLIACPRDLQWVKQHANILLCRESWLDRQHKKKRRNAWCLCVGCTVFVGVIALIVVVLIWLNRHGWFRHGEAVTFP